MNARDELLAAVHSLDAGRIEDREITLALLGWLSGTARCWDDTHPAERISALNVARAINGTEPTR